VTDRRGTKHPREFTHPLQCKEGIVSRLVYYQFFRIISYLSTTTLSTRTCPDRPWDPPSLLYNGYQVFPGGKERPGRDADPSPFLVPWSRKGRAIPLLPLWAVRPVQSLSACTGVQFILIFTLSNTDSVWKLDH